MTRPSLLLSGLDLYLGAFHCGLNASCVSLRLSLHGVCPAMLDSKVASLIAKHS